MQLCCIFLLLFAQQSALTHTLWHAAGGHASHAHELPASGGDAHDHDAGANGALCAYHLAFGALLGAHVCAAAVVAPPTHACVLAALPLPGRIAAEAVPAVSRGPPLLL